MKHHHVMVHDERLTAVEVECDFCGESMVRDSDRLGEKVYCSKRCMGKDKENTVVVECDNCGDEVERVPSAVYDHNYCSTECKGEHMSVINSGERNPLWKESVTLECEYCGDEYERRPSREDISRFCSASCRSSNLTGPASGLWKGGAKGISDRLRTHLNKEPWDKTAERVREKYDRECQMCGVHSSELSMSLHVHHIVPLVAGGTNDTENLIPLCPSCHQTTDPYIERIVEPHITKYAE